MQPIKPQLIDIAAHAMLSVDYRIIISNVLTYITATNGKPSSMRSFDGDTLADWRTEAHTYVKTDASRSRIEQLINQLGERASAPINVFLKQFSKQSALLVSDPEYVPNAGERLALDLVQSGKWAERYVVNPSLGYPRRWLEMKAKYPGKHAPFLFPLNEAIAKRPPITGVPESDSTPAPTDFVETISELVMLMDRPAFSMNLIPEAKTIAGRDPKEPFFGQSKAALRQVERLVAIGLMYEFQGLAFCMRLAAPIWKFSYEIALACYPKERPMLEAYNALWTAVVERIPLHPLLVSIANQLSGVQVSTYYHTKATVLRDFTTASALPFDQKTGTSSMPVLGQAFLANAAADYAQFSAIRDNWPLDWVSNVTPNLPVAFGRSTVFVPDGFGTIGNIMDTLVRYQDYVNQWPEIARAVGWSNGVATVPVTVEAAGADFVLCDGDGYSDTPVSVLLGYRPSLSMGNTLASGLSRRFSTDFGTGPNPYTDPSMSNGGVNVPVEQVWSTLAVNGFQTATRQADLLVKFYMPPGMLMGEVDAEIRQIGAATDPVGRMVVDWFTERSPNGYVRHWYGAPATTTSRDLPNGKLMRTDWDVVVDAKDTNGQGVLLDAYGPANVDKKLEAFVYRDSWKDRIPVRLSRGRQVDLFDERGAYMFSQDFDGHVVFDDKIDLTHDASGVEPFRGLLPTSEPSLLEPGVHEVTAPEDSKMT